MAAPEKVSFTIRRPSPLSRAPSSGADSDSSNYKVPALPRHLMNPNDSTPGSPLARSTASSPNPRTTGHPYVQEPDSSDEDDDIKDELVTGFDRFGVQRLNKERLSKSAPLVIPALKNKDWRDLARKRRSAAQYVPPSAKAETGKDGSVGGLGTRDSINSGPVLSGLQRMSRPLSVKQEDDEPTEVPVDEDVKMEADDDEDKQALRAILAGMDGAEHDEPIIDIIPTPVSEAEAYKQDIDELPEGATLEDYARVPVSQFGAALLRGMGWKEGTAATRKPGKGLVEPYLPEARPALLGIGAKEREVLDDGSKRKGGVKRPEKRYVPLIKKEKDDRSSFARDDRDKRRERSRSPPRNGTSTRRGSRSRERGIGGGDRGDNREDRRRETSAGRDRDRDRRRDNRDRNRDRDNRPEDRDRDRYRGNSEKERRRDRSQERRQRD